MNMGKRYREEFTKKIPNLAMHTGIRRDIVNKDLLRDPDKFLMYLNDENHSPDKRFLKLIETIHSKTYLPTKDVKEISKLSNINLYPDVTKEEVANFLNYIYDLTTHEHHHFIASDINDAPRGKKAVLQASNQTLIANMNLNIAETSIYLWKVDEIVSYSNATEAVLISKLSDDMDYRKQLEKFTNRKHEAGFLVFTRTYDKYLIGLDSNTISKLLHGEFREKTLMVKWGLYDLESLELNYFPKSRKPDVVIYNTVQNLEDKFFNWFKNGKIADYIILGASEDHPFHSLILKVDGVIHFVNTYGNKLVADFVEKNNNSLHKIEPSDLKNEAKHINNLLSMWMGMDWEVDWFETMINKEYLVYRK